MLLDNSLTLKIRYLELTQSCPQAPELAHHYQGSPSLHLPTTHGAQHNTEHAVRATNSYRWDRPLSPRLWHLTNDRSAIFDFNSGTGPFSFLNSLTDTVIHLDNLMRLYDPFLLVALEELHY